jgi:hypothetical protein
VVDYTFTINFTITSNVPPTLNSALITDQTILAPDGLNWSYGSVISNDPEGLAYTKSLEFNGTTTIPTWISIDLTTFSFSIISTSNSISGVHTLTLVIEDDFNAPVRDDFLLTIGVNTSPVKVRFIDSASIVNYNYLFIQFEDVHTLFVDPDGRPMTATITQANGDPIPSFLTYDITSNTMFGTPSLINVGTWTLIYVASDDHSLTEEIPFKVIVNPCYYKCSNCTTDDYNMCLTCHSTYYLQFSQ